MGQKHISAYRGAGLKADRVTKKEKKEHVSAYAAAVKNRGGIAGGVGYVAKRAGIDFLRVGEGVVDAALVPVDLLTGNVDRAKSRFMDSPVDDMRERLEEEYNPGKVAGFIGNVAGGIGQSIGYGLISAIPYAGKPMMYSSIVEQGISSAAEKTGKVGLKEIGYGATVGAIEGTLESKLGAGVNTFKSIGSAILKKTGLNVAESAAKAGGKSMLKSVLTETAKGAAGEFAEEAISEAVDPALLRLYNIDENAQFSLKDVAYAGLIGGLSGGMMSAGPAAINYRSAVSTGRALQESGLDGALIDRARYTLSALEAAQTRSTGQIQGKPEGETKETAKEWLSRTSENRRVKRLSKETAELADKIRRNIQAYENSLKDPAMAKSEPVAAILGELRGNLFLVGYAYEADVIEQVMIDADDKQRQAFVDAVNEVLAAQGKKHDYTLADFDANRDDIRRGLAGRLMMDELQGDTAEYGAEASQKPAQAATSPWDGMADDEDVSGYKAAGEAEEALLKAAVNQSVPRGSVQAMLDEYRKGTDLTPAEFAEGWSDGVHLIGRYGLKVDETADSAYNRLPQSAREASTRIGRETAEGERKAAEEKAKAKKKPADMAGKKGTVVYGEDLNIRKLSDEQYAAYKNAVVFASVLDTDIVLETDLKTETGKTINGMYNKKTNRIHININAMRNGQSIALYTLGHEVTHYIKAWSPEKYNALSDFVMEHLGGKAPDLIATKAEFLRQMPDYKDYTVSQLNDLAAEEVVADGMELVLTDGKILDELARREKTVWQKIKALISMIIADIRKYYGNLNQASKTAKVLGETMDSLDEIERLFTEGVTEAGERTRTAEVDVTISGDGDIIYAIDETPETPDVSDSAFDEALHRAGLSHLVEDTAEAEATETAPPPRRAARERDPEEDSRDRIQAHETLANALMEAAQNEHEFRLVKNYQKKAAELADAEVRKKDLRKKTAAVNRQIDLLKSKKDSIDRDRPEPEVKEAEAWLENELNEAIARKQSMLDEMNELDDKLRTETDKLLSLASAKQLRKLIRAERSKAAAMERSAERSRQRELNTKEWAKETVKKAREESNEQQRKSREWAKETVRNIRKESNEKIYKARREATDYKRAVYHTAYAKADEKNQKYRDRLDEMAKQSMERREITIRMREARRVLGYLNTMLYHPTKQKHVPESLQALVDKTLRSADPKQFGINRDHIREMSELAGKIRKLESKAGRTTDEQKTLDAMKTKYEKLEADTISVKRQAEALMTAFEQYVTSTTDGEQIDKNMLEGLRQTVTEIEEAPLNEMTLRSLKAVEKIYAVIKHQVDTANQAFATKKAANIDEMSTKANTQVKAGKELKFLSPRASEWAGLQKAREYLWKNMKPLTVFEAIGSDELMSIFKRVLDGEDVWITDILEAKKVLDEAKKEYGYNKWNLKERREVTTADGSKVSLTLGEMMSLYAYNSREQAEEHLSAGGFVFAPNAEAIESFKGDKVKYRTHLNDQTPHRMRKEDIAKMSELLTEKQRAYAKQVQEYLTSLGAKGNEVSRKLYGIDLFNETAYFPIKSSHDYIETSTGKSGDPNIKSRGTFKETVPKAGNPIVLEDFMEVVGNHVNTMAIYHAFVLPVEDLTRVWNYTPVNIKRDADGRAILDDNGMPVADTEGEAGYNSLKAEITKKYGKEANDYILQLLRDLNGGARRESAASILDKGLTAFKRSATMLSLSTIVQQPTSIIRAMAYVDAKHFKGASFVPWETVKKYAPVAAIKEMGGFDTGTGARTAEYINAKEYDSIKDAAKAAVKPEIYGGDPNVRAEAFGWLTGKADEVSWRYMFGAIVNEQAERLGKPKDSEAVLKAAGERFAEVVRRTQVYDSTLTRSEYMRSKDGLMKMATAFGAEPTTVVSMVVDAIIKAERGDKAFLRKSAAGIAFSVIANAAVASLIYAMRDDDEDETIPEKYVQSLTSELIEGFNPLEYLPIARDIMSMFKGYEIERSDMALIGNLMEQVELITSSKRSVPDKIFGVTGAVSAFFGLPVTNVYRDLKGLVKTGEIFTNSEEQTGAGLGHAMGDAVRGQFNLFSKLFGAESGNAYELYTAYVSGDTAHYNRVKARYKTDSAAEMALRQALRDHDPRISEAAQARLSGDLAVYESIVDQIESEGIFDRNIVIRAINNEMLDLKDEDASKLVPKDETATDEEETPESLYKASDLNNALERGDTEDFAAIMAALVEDKVSTGKTEAQAKASVKSSITAHWKKLYIEAWARGDDKERKRIIALLTDTGLYGSRNDVATTVMKWVQDSK